MSEEPKLDPALEAELRALIAARDIKQATRRLEAATGLPYEDCIDWTRARWCEHNPLESPAPTSCPYCGGRLKTAAAQQCLACGADWRAP